MNDDLNYASGVLSAGGTILYPTDTIWGIGCDAANDAAVNRIFEIKKRPDAKSMIILVDSERMLYDYVPEIPDVVFDLIEVSNKPLTIIYPGARGLSPALLAEDGSAGIRITDDRFCISLIKKLGRPLVSTSANLSGMPYPGTFADIGADIRDAVDYVVKWRQDNKSAARPSGIIKVHTDGSIRVIRE
jgi:L-threonylcarbamoyladenylate synthase